MYRFIMDDLNRAEAYLQGYERGNVAEANLAVVYGMKARFYLEMASRFELYPEDLSEQKAHETDESLAQYGKLEIATADDCYRHAATYARLAIAEGYSPLTQSEWHDTATGFNSANHAWLFGIVTGSEDEGVQSWKSFTGMVASEQTFGVTFYLKQYGVYRIMGKSLYDKMPDADWRKKTWIDPADAGKSAAASKYATLLSAFDWALLPAYTNLKFRPGGGNTTDFLTGTVVDIPLMRVEEMYFIEAEATAHTSGYASGLALLKNFMNSYRYTDTYNPMVSSLEEFVDELLVQKRIEFWGEGILMWDWKRLELPVTRGYKGTNCPESYCFNSPSGRGYVAPWLNVFITSEESQYNAILDEQKNPDPSGYGVAWSE